jgi:hypothetical protein
VVGKKRKIGRGENIQREQRGGEEENGKGRYLEVVKKINNKNILKIGIVKLK